MKQCRAETLPIETFVAGLKQTGDFDRAFTDSATPQSARDFVQYTFDVIRANRVHQQSVVFTFGGKT